MTNLHVKKPVLKQLIFIRIFEEALKGFIRPVKRKLGDQGKVPQGATDALFEPLGLKGPYKALKVPIIILK